MTHKGCWWQSRLSQTLPLQDFAHRITELFSNQSTPLTLCNRSNTYLRNVALHQNTEQPWPEKEFGTPSLLHCTVEKTSFWGRIYGREIHSFITIDFPTFLWTWWESSSVWRRTMTQNFFPRMMLHKSVMTLINFWKQNVKLIEATPKQFG